MYIVVGDVVIVSKNNIKIVEVPQSSTKVSCKDAYQIEVLKGVINEGYVGSNQKT